MEEKGKEEKKMMEKLFGWLDDYFSKDERVKIMILEDAIDVMKKQNAALRSEVQQLKKELETRKVKPPEWLDTSKQPYFPRINVVYHNKTIGKTILDPRDFYAATYTLKKIAKNWEGESHDEKLMSIWAYVTRHGNYEHDYGEDWRFPVVTNAIRKGDCEDHTALFVALAHAAGIPADSVFNATGWFYGRNGEKFGHSFPIAKREDGKWYVYEATLSYPREPILFKGSNYDASWGVSNWEFVGILKPEYVQNGKAQV